MAQGSEFRVKIWGVFLDANGNSDYEVVQDIMPIAPSGTVDMGMGLWETFTFNGAAANGQTYQYGYAITECRVNGGEWLPAYSNVTVTHTNLP